MNERKNTTLELIKIFEDPDRKLNIPKLGETSSLTLSYFMSAAEELYHRFQNMIPLIREQGVIILQDLPSVKADSILSAAQRGVGGDMDAILEVFGLIAESFQKFFERVAWAEGNQRASLFIGQNFRPLAILFLTPDAPDATDRQLGDAAKDFFFKKNSNIVLKQYLATNIFVKAWIPVKDKDKYRWNP